MMLDRILVSDIQDEIQLIQTKLKSLSEEMNDTQLSNVLKDGSSSPASSLSSLSSTIAAAPLPIADKFNSNVFDVQSDPVKIDSNRFKTNENLELDEKPSIDVLRKNSDKTMDTLLPNISCQTIKNEMKGEHDLIPITVNEFNSNVGRSMPCKPVHNNIGNMSVNNFVSSTSNLAEMDVKPSFQSISSNKENNLAQLDLNFGYDPSNLLGNEKRTQSDFDVKKELDNLDIESEITPSYIIKKCDQPSNQREIVHSPLSTSDFDYLCSPSGDSSGNNTTNTRRKDELIACDKEPYDEWLCIQKELNLISEKRSNDHLNIDGFMESTLRNFSNDDDDDDNDPCSSTKLNVDNQFSDLFNQRSNDPHNLDDEKGDMDGHLPLSELFNDSMVNNAVDSVDSNDKSVENRLENMFNDNVDFDKTNDLVESRLEELFHGSSPTHSPVNANQVTVNKM